jgi:DNA-binding NarL/FixJ family response regulator
MHDRLRARAEGVPTPTPLQIAILHAKVAGKTDRSIARAFKLGERTVRRQLEDLISVLAVSCRAELYAEAVRHGWLDRKPG